MYNKIKNACVIGSGVMGCGIAAHLVNAGINVLLLDIKSKDTNNPNEIVNRNLQASFKHKPNLFFNNNVKSCITVGNITDDLSKIIEYNWIIEVIPENIEIKQQLFKKIDIILQNKKLDFIVSSNTSGLSINSMCMNLSEEFKSKFLITHFFNPVRYLHLLEIVTSQFTLKNIVKDISDFCTYRLGKGVIIAKDTPLFIANRIGVFGILKIIQLMEINNYTVEEVDYILGPAMGRPKSAIFKTLDIVGLDTIVSIINYCSETLKKDEEYSIFKVPKFLNDMVKKGWLGRKSKQGFYKKEGKEILVLDILSMEYKKRNNIKYESINEAKKNKELSEQIKTIINGNDRASKLALQATAAISAYSANRIFEVSDKIEDIDNAMKWGFNWLIGPFEIWDSIGVKETIAIIKQENYKIPKWVLEMNNNNSFYKIINGKKTCWNPKEKEYLSVNYGNNEEPLNLVILKTIKNNIIRSSDATHTMDLGDGVMGCEFHTKMNAIDIDTVDDIFEAINICEKNDFHSLVLYNEGDNFSVGMNLWLVYMAIQGRQWNQINDMVKKFQELCVRLKYSSINTIAAPFGLTLGGGAELSMWCNAIQASAETYMGLVEVGVGLIPGAGGNIEMISRALENVPNNKKIPLDIILSYPLQSVAMAKVGTSAMECQEMLYINKRDGITMNKKYLLKNAKMKALSLFNTGVVSPNERRKFYLPGKSAYNNFKVMLSGMKAGNFISDHDLKISLHIAKIMSGGDCNPAYPVDEQILLDLERESFLSLCGEEKTLQRIEYMLKNRKALRN